MLHNLPKLRKKSICFLFILFVSYELTIYFPTFLLIYQSISENWTIKQYFELAFYFERKKQDKHLDWHSVVRVHYTDKRSQLAKQSKLKFWIKLMRKKSYIFTTFREKFFL